jgi:hypothetical protein
LQPNRAAPVQRPQTTYPQSNPQQLWGSQLFGLKKTNKNRDLFQLALSCEYWLKINHVAESHAERDLQGRANTLSTEAPTDDVHNCPSLLDLFGKRPRLTILQPFT